MKQKNEQASLKKNKKTYISPLLQSLGSIRELTKGASSGTNDSMTSTSAMP